MNKHIFASVAASATAAILASASVIAADQPVVDQCIADWGSASPFKKGTAPDRVIAPGVKVFGIGKSNSGDETVTDKPSLVLVQPAVNVLGKSTIRLANPNGWYCFKSNVTVAGKITIAAHCNAHIASAQDDGTSVMAKDESDKGVAVMGALRVTRFDCGDKKKAN
jgi:hypothetical protein